VRCVACLWLCDRKQTTLACHALQLNWHSLGFSQVVQIHTKLPRNMMSAPLSSDSQRACTSTRHATCHTILEELYSRWYMAPMRSYLHRRDNFSTCLLANTHVRKQTATADTDTDTDRHRHRHSMLSSHANSHSHKQHMHEDAGSLGLI